MNGPDFSGFLSKRNIYIPPSKGEVSLSCSLNIGCSVIIYPRETVYIPVPLFMGPFISYVGMQSLSTLKVAIILERLKPCESRLYTT